MDVKKITSLIIEPTNTCNLRCTFCFVTDGMTRDGEMVFRFRDAEQDKVDGDRKNPLTPRPE